MRETIYGFPLVEDHSFFQITICGISYCDGSYRIERRNSQVCTLEYIIAGDGTVCLPGGNSIHPSKGDVYLLHPGEDQLYYSDENSPWIKIWCNVSGFFVEQMIRLYRLESTHLIVQCNIEPELRRFLKLATDSSLSRTEIWEQAELLFHRMLQILAGKVHALPATGSSAALILREHIDRNLNQTVSISRLAHLVSLSPSQVSRLFKTAFQTTPYEYLLARRIAMAKELLHSTGLSVKEIAHTLGFGDEHYFSTFFRKRTGQTPLDYRRSKLN